MTTLIVGCGTKLIGSLRDQLPHERLLVVEHPQLIEQRDYRTTLRSYANVAGLWPHDYLRDPSGLVTALPSDAQVTRVLPATDETSTVGAAHAADALGLPGAGVRAAEIFYDKIELRRASDQAGIANPRWREVRSLAELMTAASQIGGETGWVVKPTRRSGSQGVTVLGPGDASGLADAWQHATTAEGRVRIDPPPSTRYLVEERLSGTEVSVECLVATGDIAFGSVTAKRVQPGMHPVEIGHVVPSYLEAPAVKDLLGCMQALVTAVGFEHGILHGEWMVTEQGPVLIECAGRLAGDRITDLVTLAFDAPFMAGYATLMAGDLHRDVPVMPAMPVRAAAISFLVAQRAGVVADVIGVSEARSTVGVEAAEVRVAPGDSVKPARASRDRIGHVLATGADPATAWRNAQDAAGKIEIVVR